MKSASSISRVQGAAILTALLLLAVFLSVSASLGGGSTERAAVQLDAGLDRIPLVPHMQFLEDPAGELTVEEAAAPSQRAWSVGPVRGEQLDVGLTRSAWWGRFRLRPGGDPSRLWYLEFAKAGIGLIELYIPLPGPVPAWRMTATGATQPLASRAVKFRNYVLKLPHDFNPDGWFYVRFKTVISLNLAITLWQPSAFIDYSLNNRLVFGAIYGTLICMLFYNLFLLMGLRDRVYAYYAMYMASALFHISILYGHLDLFIDSLHLHQPIILFITQSVVQMLIAVFSRAFLNIPRMMPRLDWVIRAYIVSPILVMVMALAGWEMEASKAGLVMVLVGSVLFTIISIGSLRRGYRAARFLIWAWLVLIVGGCLYSLGGILIPRSDLTVYTYALGVALESVLLSFALADRIRLLQEEHAYLQKSTRTYRELSLTDGLTGLFNRRCLLERLGDEITRAHYLGEPLSILMLDVDNFKQFNDTHGHLEGDLVLLGLARAMTQCIRSQDSAYRYGGEEFVVLLPGVITSEAAKIGERIRRTMRETPFRPGGFGNDVQVTVSLGLAQIVSGETAQQLLQRADEALYRAKDLGKDRLAV